MNILLKTTALCLLVTSAISCKTDSRDENEGETTSVFEGKWLYEYPIQVESEDFVLTDYEPISPDMDVVADDITTVFWEAHDALCYEFMEDNRLFISCIPESKTPVECTFTVERSSTGKDSILNVWGTDEFPLFTQKLEVQSVGRDTVWLRVYDESECLTGERVFLVRKRD